MSILGNFDEYQYWRDEKLANAHSDIESCMVELANPFSLNKAEKEKIQHLCRYNNFALFEITPQDDYDEAIVAINQQLGLVDYDQHLYAQSNGLAHISKSEKQKQAEFIPYTDKAIGWHTDGYYNSVENRIRSFSLFCVSPAISGGVNQWIDPQMVYLLLREDNADALKALSHPQAMSIPSHVVGGVTRREKSTGAIFFTDQRTNQLMMRYTQRKRNIEFFNSPEIKQAVVLLDNLLSAQTPYHFEHLMAANQGMVCNNVAHNRSAFSDDPAHPRLLLRGRYLNPIS
jgi:hypothetical protein